MNCKFLCRKILVLTVSVMVSSALLDAQNENEGRLLGKAELYKAKKTALDHLSDPVVIKKFGIISDSIWKFAELGMQEFRSSAILIKVLEEEGFSVEKGVAGIPTCFVAVWGNGSPVIGILGEYDALPMLSQKPLAPVKDPVVPGGPGHVPRALPAGPSAGGRAPRRAGGPGGNAGSPWARPSVPR